MPEGLDYSEKYIYKFINKIASKNCKLHPNVITATNVLLSFYLCKSVHLDSLNLIPLYVLRAFFDCLDGAVARKCNKKSKLGHYLDHYNDITFLITMSVLFFYKLL